jgi:hypothetical protein
MEPLLQQNVYDSRKLPSAVWYLFFCNVALLYQNFPVQVSTVNLKSGGTIKRTQIGDYTYLEQNPHSVSQYGKMAREGHKILWIIHHPTDRYVGRVIDGKVEKL